MRSTGFVFLSIMFHLGIVFAIAFTPTKIFNEKSGDDTVELSMTEAAENMAEGKAQEEGAQAATAPQAPAPVEQPVAAAPKPEVKKSAPVPLPVAAKPAPVAKAKPVAAVAAKPSAKKSSPQISEAAIAAEVAAESGEAVAQSTSEETKEEMKHETADALVPVKESAPAGVESSTEEKEEQAVAAPAPKAAEAPVAAVAASAGAGAGSGEAGKGGDSKDEAVSYLELKQSGGNKPPAYPLKARQENRQGQVELIYQVTKDGKVTDVQVAKSSGSKDLDDEAVRAISQYRFMPGQEGWARHPINFALKGNSAPAPSRGLRTKNAAQAKAE